jgi:antitoxin component YwqK of YwqJK toxin-antitoxin module
MKTPKKLNIICFALLMLTNSSCTNAEAEKEIIALKAEIAQLKRNESYEFVSKKMTYYLNGQTKEEENYQNSELQGDYREYYKNGQISVKCSYNEGKKNGEFFEFYHDGVVWEHGYFTNGDYDGEYTTYFIDGKIKSYELYKKGDRIEAIWYDNKGNIEYQN